MKRIKNILYLITLCLIATVIGYFVYSFTQFNDGSKIAQEVFKNGFYRTRETEDFISFGSFKNSVICVDDVYYFIDEVKYEKGIFTLTDYDTDSEKVYVFSVVNEDIIYSSTFNTYFYNIDLFEG